MLGLAGPVPAFLAARGHVDPVEPDECAADIERIAVDDGGAVHDQRDERRRRKEQEGQEAPNGMHRLHQAKPSPLATLRLDHALNCTIGYLILTCPGEIAWLRN